MCARANCCRPKVSCVWPAFVPLIGHAQARTAWMDCFLVCKRACCSASEDVYSAALQLQFCLALHQHCVLCNLWPAAISDGLQQVSHWQPLLLCSLSGAYTASAHTCEIKGPHFARSGVARMVITCLHVYGLCNFKTDSPFCLLKLSKIISSTVYAADRASLTPCIGILCVLSPTIERAKIYSVP